MEQEITTQSDPVFEEIVDPIYDIIDYLVRCSKISFKNAHVNESELRTTDKVQIALSMYKKSPKFFLTQFGKYLAKSHIQYFENLSLPTKEEQESFQDCITELKLYHSDESKHKRIRNRRYKALQRLQEQTDYFSEKQMMYRNPLLYEQLVGQYLDDDEVKERDGVDRDNLTFLNMILDTVDHNQMRQKRNEQIIQEDLESLNFDNNKNDLESKPRVKKQWGDFDTPDATPSYKPEYRKQSMISAPERDLFREEFLQEMYSSFIEGRDVDIDYDEIDNDEQYDDLQQLSQDAEDRYFDSESNDVENLEEHMRLVQEYGRKKSIDSTSVSDDPLDVFMNHITNKQTIND